MIHGPSSDDRIAPGNAEPSAENMHLAPYGLTLAF